MTPNENEIAELERINAVLKRANLPTNRASSRRAATRSKKRLFIPTSVTARSRFIRSRCASRPTMQRFI